MKDNSFITICGVLTIMTPFLMNHCSVLDSKIDREKQLDEVQEELSSLKSQLNSDIEYLQEQVEFVQNNPEYDLDFDIEDWKSEVEVSIDRIIEKCYYEDADD